MARKTILVCDNCGTEVGDGKGAVIEVQVGAADAGARDSHERVGGRLERGVIDLLDAHVVGSVEDSSFHS